MADLVLRRSVNDWRGWKRVSPESLVTHGLTEDGRWIAMRHDGPSTFFDFITPPPRDNAALVEAWGLPRELPEGFRVADAGAGLAWVMPAPGLRWAEPGQEPDAVLVVEYGHFRTGFYKARFAVKRV